MAVLPYVYNLLDISLGQIFRIQEPYSLILFSFFVTALLTLCYKYVTDQHVMKSLKERIKVLQKKMNEYKDNPAKLSEIQKETLETNFQYLGHSLKPTIITSIPLILVFGWLRQHYTSLGNPSILFGFGWLGTYIVFSILFSFIIRKVLKVA